MKLHLPKYASLKWIASFFLIMLFFFACKKNMDDNNVDPNTIPPDLATKVTSSVSGFVTNEANVPVTGASVKVGLSTTTTDQYGYFEVKNVEVVKIAATVTVSTPGYFNAIKTYIATAGKAAFFRIKLIPKTNVGTISSTMGGNITLTNGLTIALPANAVVNASTNAVYTGTINVAAYWIDPTSNELHKIMPGDLRGIDDAGTLKGLTTYGMAAVELQGASGELLQIATGKKATLTMPVPASILSNAPTTIPLWSFDEANGLWKQEGQATKTGNTYTGEVSHFSFWNCDVPNSFVQFNCTFLNAEGRPLSFIPVKISVVGSPYDARWGYTDSSGYVSGGIPPNAELLLEISSDYDSCIGFYSQNFTTATTNISLGNITIVTTFSDARVTGTVTNCNSNPVSDGYIIMIRSNQFYRYPINNAGYYDFSTFFCSNNPTVYIIAEGIQHSTLLTHTLVAGNNTLSNLEICAPSFLNAISNGYIYHPSAPREIVNRNKTLDSISPNSVMVELGDLGSANYYAIFMVDASNNIIITAAPGAAGTPYSMFAAGLPTTSPGYTPQWPGSSQCNNIYDPVQREYRVRYGYGGATGWRVVEEIIKIY